MKKLLIPLFLFSMVFLISAAPPILRQFGTTNTPTALTNIIQSLAGGGSQVWTNDAGVVSLIDTNHGINIGSLSPLTGLSKHWINFGGALDVDSVGSHDINIETTSSENDYNNDAYINLQTSVNDGDIANGLFYLSVNNTNITHAFAVSLKAGDPAAGSIYFKTNSTFVFKITPDGVVSANGFAAVNGSYPPNVGGVTYNLKVVTNGSDTATLHFTNGVLMSVTAP